MSLSTQGARAYFNYWIGLQENAQKIPLNNLLLIKNKLLQQIMCFWM